MKTHKIWIALALSSVIAISEAEAQSTAKAPIADKPASKSSAAASAKKKAQSENRIEKTYAKKIITTDKQSADNQLGEIKTRVTIIESGGKGKRVLDTTFSASAESAQVKDYLASHGPSTKGDDKDSSKGPKRRIKTIVRQYGADGDEFSTTIQKSGHSDLAESLANIGPELERGLGGLDGDLRGALQELEGLTDELDLAFNDEKSDKKRRKKRVERYFFRHNDGNAEGEKLDLEDEDLLEGADEDSDVIIRVPKIKRLRKLGQGRGDGQPDFHLYHLEDGAVAPEGRSDELHQYHGPMGVRPRVKTYRYEFRSDDNNGPSSRNPRRNHLNNSRELLEREGLNLESKNGRIVVRKMGKSAQILLLDTVVRGSIVKEVPKSDLRNALAKADISITPQGPGSLDLEVNSVSSEPLKVVLATLEGKELVNTLLYKQTGTFSTELDLGQSARGTYLIQLTQGKETITKKVKVGR